VPATFNVGGFIIPQPPATTASTEPVLTLPHPSVSGGGVCTTCHLSGSSVPAIGYDHDGGTAMANDCASCHETGSPWVGTVWNDAGTQSAGQGDTRAIGLSNLSSSSNASRLTCGTLSCTMDHFFSASTPVGATGAVDCSTCHRVPRTADGFSPDAVTTGANAYCPSGDSACGGDCAPTGTVCCGGGSYCLAGTACCGGYRLPDGGYIPSQCCAPGVDAGFGTSQLNTTPNAWRFYHPPKNTQVPMCCMCHTPQTMTDGGIRCAG
jgi:hypothetical protein